MKSNGKSKSGVISCIAITLIIVLLTTTLGYLTSGFKNWDYKTWIIRESKKEIIATDNDGNEMVGGNTYPMPSNMIFRSAASLTSVQTVTIIATVKPNESDDKTVDWVVEWVNPSSAWANGKPVSDYITLVPTSNGSTTANVSCLTDFGEQIKITVISRANEHAKAECLVDYAKRIKNAKIDFQKSATTYHVISSNDTVFNMIASTAYPFLGDVGYDLLLSTNASEYSAYTIDDTFTLSWDYVLSSEYINAVTAKGYTYETTSFNASLGFYAQTHKLWYGVKVPNIGTIDSFGYISTLNNVCKNIIRDNPNISIGTLTLTITGSYSSFTKAIDVKCNVADISILATSIDLSNSSLVV